MNFSFIEKNLSGARRDAHGFFCSKAGAFARQFLDELGFNLTMEHPCALGSTF
jgi:hypothetical protein